MTSTAYSNPADSATLARALHRRLLLIKRRREAALLFADLFTELGRLKLAARLVDCYTPLQIQSSQDSIQVFSYNHCEMRICPFCSYRWAARYARKYEAHILRLAAERHRLQYLTLTVSSMPALDRSILDDLWACWAKLRRQTLFADVVATLACMQITRGQAGWHPHLHIILIGGPVISKGEVQTAWYFLTKDSFNGYEVDVRPIKRPDIRKVLTYSLRMAPVKTADDLRQLFDSIYGIRLVRTTGKLIGVNPSTNDKAKVFQQPKRLPSEEMEMLGIFDTDAAIDDLIAASSSYSVGVGCEII